MPLPAAKAKERTMAQAPAAGSKKDRDLKTARDARKKSVAQEKPFLDKNKDQGVGAEERQATNRAAPRRGEGAALGKVAEDQERVGRADEEVPKQEVTATEEKPSEKGVANEPSPSTRELRAAAPQALTAPPAAADRIQAPSPFDALVQRLGIPPTWDQAAVTREALERAEPELRALYVSGGAGQDSGRIRLYLAEAVRARYTPGDSVAYEEIEHHYKRAIALSKGDAKTARVAAERLQTLQK